MNQPTLSDKGVVMDEFDMHSFLKREIAKQYRSSRWWNEGHIPSQVVSEAFADNVLNIPQLAGMIAGQEIGDDWNHYYRDLEARQIDARLGRVEAAVFPGETMA